MLEEFSYLHEHELSCQKKCEIEFSMSNEDGIEANFPKYFHSTRLIIFPVNRVLMTGS